MSLKEDPAEAKDNTDPPAGGASGATNKVSSNDDLIQSLRTSTRLPDKIMGILLSNEAPEAIWWLQKGKAFAMQKENFQDEILTKHFRGNKFKSLVRNLHRWGFKRMTCDSKNAGKTIAFSHSLFTKDSPELVKEIQIVNEKDSKNEPPPSMLQKRKLEADAPLPSPARAAPARPQPNPSSLSLQDETGILRELGSPSSRSALNQLRSPPRNDASGLLFPQYGLSSQAPLSQLSSADLTSQNPLSRLSSAEIHHGLGGSGGGRDSLLLQSLYGDQQPQASNMQMLQQRALLEAMMAEQRQQTSRDNSSSRSDPGERRLIESLLAQRQRQDASALQNNQEQLLQAAIADQQRRDMILQQVPADYQALLQQRLSGLSGGSSLLDPNRLLAGTDSSGGGSAANDMLSQLSSQPNLSHLTGTGHSHLSGLYQQAGMQGLDVSSLLMGRSNAQQLLAARQQDNNNVATGTGGLTTEDLLFLAAAEQRRHLGGGDGGGGNPTG